MFDSGNLSCLHLLVLRASYLKEAVQLGHGQTYLQSKLNQKSEFCVRIFVGSLKDANSRRRHHLLVDRIPLG